MKKSGYPDFFTYTQTLPYSIHPLTIVPLTGNVAVRALLHAVQSPTFRTGDIPVRFGHAFTASNPPLGRHQSGGLPPGQVTVCPSLPDTRPLIHLSLIHAWRGLLRIGAERYPDQHHQHPSTLFHSSFCSFDTLRPWGFKGSTRK